jgi:hypothetical protein
MSKRAGDAPGESVPVSIRYRPTADVLIIQVDNVTDEAVQHTTPDADTTIEWVRRPDGSRYLVGAQILSASARAERGRMSADLPKKLDARLRKVVVTLAGATTDAGPLSKSFTEITVPETELALPDDLKPKSHLVRGISRPTKIAPDIVLYTKLPPPNPLDASLLRSDDETFRNITADFTAPAWGDWDADDLGDAPNDLAHALSALAEAIETMTIDADPVPTMRLVTSLRELGSVIQRSEGKHAPGCSAAARLALRGGTPLTSRERARLAKLIAQLDDPKQWASITLKVQRFTDRLSGSHR